MEGMKAPVLSNDTGRKRALIASAGFLCSTVAAETAGTLGPLWTPFPILGAAIAFGLWYARRR